MTRLLFAGTISPTTYPADGPTCGRHEKTRRKEEEIDDITQDTYPYSTTIVRKKTSSTKRRADSHRKIRRWEVIVPGKCGYLRGAIVNRTKYC